MSAYDRLVVLRCAAKLLAVIGRAVTAEPMPVPDAEDWYANLLWLDRRKCLLLTHSATLFSMRDLAGQVDVPLGQLSLGTQL